jgi:hypothetical protein
MAPFLPFSVIFEAYQSLSRHLHRKNEKEDLSGFCLNFQTLQDIYNTTITLFQWQLFPEICHHPLLKAQEQFYFPLNCSVNNGRGRKGPWGHCE